MKMTVTNKCIQVGTLEIGGVGSSSLVLIGDAETITSSSYFDTPDDSLIYDVNIPFLSTSASMPAGKDTAARTK